jgi:hypothetical protein
VTSALRQPDLIAHIDSEGSDWVPYQSVRAFRPIYSNLALLPPLARLLVRFDGAGDETRPLRIATREVDSAVAR